MASFLSSKGLRLVVFAAFAGSFAWSPFASSQGTVAPGPGSNAPKVAIVEPPAPLLPTNDRLVADTNGVLPADKPELAAVLKEDGLSRTESRAVKVPIAAGTTNSGWVTAYEFGDATGAFSAYTYLRLGGRPMPSGSRVNASEVELPGGERVFYDGVNVVRAVVKQYPESATGLLKTIDVGLPKFSGRRGVAPLLPRLLPAARLNPDTLRYAIGPAGYQAMGGILPAGMLGWDKSLETATADYTAKGGKTGTLTMLLYPTPQIAGDRGRAVEKEVNDEGGAAKFGVVKMRRLGPLVGMTSGNLPPDQAQALMDGLRLNEEITYDKPMPLEFHAEVRKTASLLQNIAVLSGVLILAAVLLGLFLGGARAGWRVMHGKSASSEPEFLTISLRDEPKAHFVPKDSDPQ